MDIQLYNIASVGHFSKNYPTFSWIVYVNGSALDGYNII